MTVTLRLGGVSLSVISWVLSVYDDRNQVSLNSPPPTSAGRDIGSREQIDADNRGQAGRGTICKKQRRHPGWICAESQMNPSADLNHCSASPQEPSTHLIIQAFLRLRDDWIHRSLHLLCWTKRKQLTKSADTDQFTEPCLTTLLHFNRWKRRVAPPTGVACNTKLSSEPWTFTAIQVKMLLCFRGKDTVRSH